MPKILDISGLAAGYGRSPVLSDVDISITAGPLTFINANFGFALGIKGFAAAALGGLGTVGGAVLGGLILGLAETLSSAYLGSDIKDIIVLSVLYLVLIFRPTGLVGEADIAKV